MSPAPSLLLSLAAAAAAVAVAASAAPSPRFGVDVSTPVSASAALCMRQQHNISFAISRAWYSDGEGVDRAAISSGVAFKAANISFDVYMFPCSFGIPAADQVTQLLANLSAAGVQYGRVWFDVESNPDPKCAWSTTDKASNCAFMGDLVAAAQASGVPFGVYSSIHEWTLIMTPASDPHGCTAASAANLPLWYPHYERPPNPTYSDFSPFGGWTAPAMKQFGDGDVPPGDLCGISVDNDVRV